MNNRILLVSNISWTIYQFRYGLIKYLIDNGYEVSVIATEDSAQNTFAESSTTDKLKDLGVNYYHVYFDRKGINPLRDIRTLLKLIKLYYSIKPSFIFHYTIKPNIYGTIAAKICSIRSIAITTGLGHIFINPKNFKSKIAIMLYKISLKFADQVWFLNNDDCSTFLAFNLVDKNKVKVLPGEGVDTKHYDYIETEENNGFQFILIGRLLWDKGIGEYIEAARIIKKKYRNVKFKILGFIDEDNPSAVSRDQLLKWENEKVIEYLGVRDDVRPFISQSDCIVHPSFYREGVPRILLEAASMGKPIITTDNVGCRDVVEDGLNGFLCKVKDHIDLANKMEKMIIMNRNERQKFGIKGREKVINEFDERIVISHYMEVITEVCIKD